MIAWTRSSSAWIAVILAACTPTPDEVSSTSAAESSDDSTTTSPPSTTTRPGEDTMGTGMGTGTGIDPTGSMVTTADDTSVGVGSTTDESESGPSPCIEPGCDGNEVCEQDQCVEACGGRWGAGSYGYCLDEFGVVDTADACGPGHTCVYWGEPIEQTACSRQGCAGACDCPPPAATGNATVSCGQITDPPGMNDCYLSCESGETCPDDMVCIDGVCTTDAPEVAVYGDCGNLASDCAAPGFCVGTPSDEAVCTMGCTLLSDCSAMVPPGGSGTVACSDVVPGNPGFECYMSCVAALTCPTGMTCINGTLCMWPD